MSDIQEALYEVIYPLLEMLGFLIRPLGALAIGLTAGSVLKHVLAHKAQQRFYVPLIFLSVFLLMLVGAAARWSGPGSWGFMGLGLLAGYLFLKPTLAKKEDETTD